MQVSSYLVSACSHKSPSPDEVGSGVGNDVSTVTVGIATVERLKISDKKSIVGVGPTDEASAAENRNQLLLEEYC